MARKYTITIFSFLLLFTQYSQAECSKDSLVNPAEIKFKSEAEKKAYIYFLKDSSSANFLQLMMSISSKPTSSDFSANTLKLDEFVGQMKSAKLEDMKEKKRIKFIYDKLHAAFLKQYQNMSYFPAIFDDGTYNCVTATALFSYVFDQLSIPYSIMESTDHVFLLTYPELLNIPVETTNPSKGSLVYNSQMQQTFINYLKTNKIISEDDSKSKSTAELFNKYFFSENHINAKKLAGIQFYNEGIEDLNTSNYSDAFNSFEKSYLLYPSKKLSFFLFVCLAELISKANYTDSMDIQYLAKASYYKGLGITVSNIQAEFYRLIQKILVDKSDFDGLDKAYNYLVKHINDKEILEGLKFGYFAEEARVYYLKENSKKAYDAAVNAYNLRPSNADIQTLFMAIVDKSLVGLSSSQFIQKIEQIEIDFPQVRSNANFTNHKIHAYLGYFAELYDLKDIQKAEKTRLAFEELAAANPQININSNMVGESYSSAAFYYYKKGNKAKARELFEIGLKYAPENYTLKYRLRGL